MMGPMPDCPIDEECLEWAHTYLKDCVCSHRDEVSLLLGLISVFSWGVAEVPQIITNFREQSTEGVSLAFLMTWVVGDVFNLAGCYLEPATLPTQFYMALLYTLTTVVLVGQTIHYDYVVPWLGREHIVCSASDDESVQKDGHKVDLESLRTQPVPVSSAPVKDASKPAIETSPVSSPQTINVPRSRRSSSRDLYYMSARSLASSHTPTAGSYLAGSRGSGGYGQGFLRHPSYTALNACDGAVISTSTSDSNPPTHGVGSAGILRTAASSILLVGSLGFSSRLIAGGLGSSARYNVGFHRSLLGYPSNVFPRLVGEDEVSALGVVFGWIMAAIYMGGRLPQIWLNMRRGTVEGLNPLMFVFALVGNATYVGSILVRSTEWAKVKPNFPWLVDAAVCVLLDCFILCQFSYYTLSKRRSGVEEDESGDYERLK